MTAKKGSETWAPSPRRAHITEGHSAHVSPIARQGTVTKAIVAAADATR
jgi:hypothetical protein